MGGRAGLAALAVSALIAGCGAPTPPRPPSAPPGTDSPWRACSYGECADVTVPLDHDDPSGATLRLAVARARAIAPSRRGTIFLNPGGPGVSGREYVQQFSRAGLEAYDIVGWDPRGVGASEGITCLDGADADAYLALDGSPDTAAERDQLLQASRAFGEACRADAGALLGHLSLADNARDLEILRAALTGEQAPLLYIGWSYGTALGAVYAELFGVRVGRMVLDGGVDVNQPAVPQVVGFDRALARMGPDAEASVRGLLAALERQPLRVGERELTESLAAVGVAWYLYSGRGAWPALVEAVRAAELGDGAALLASADALNGRRPDGSFGGLFSSFRAIHCADAPRPTAEEADARWAEAVAAAPLLGPAFGPDYTCVDWPAPPSAPPAVRAVDAASPILVIGTTGDPATPYEWAVALADDLATGVLITHDGDGHTAYGRSSACVDAEVRTYLTDPGFTPSPTDC